MNLMLSCRDLVDSVIERIWNRGELELADALFTDDYVNHGGLIPDLIRGPEAIKLSVALYRSAFPTFQVAIDELTTDNGAVVLRWVAYPGSPLLDGSASSKRELRGITRGRLLGAKIAESWTVWDSRTAIVRLRAVRRKVTGHRADDIERLESEGVSRPGG